MSRSQRHKVIIQGTDSAGKGLSEKQPAIVYIQQAAASQSLTVPTGAPGGPLQGSSLAGFPPTTMPVAGMDTMISERADVTPGAFVDHGQFNLSGNPIYQDLPPTWPGAGEKPVLNSINPSSAKIGDPDLTMNVNGSKFVQQSVIWFNGGPEPTTFNNSGQLSTVVKPSTAAVPGSYPVWVVNPDGQRTDLEKMFTFTDPQVTEVGGRTIPAGPFTINRIEDHADGILVQLADGDVQVGDTVLIEATGNTSVNGSYPVLQVDGLSIVVDTDTFLTSPIEAKGRLTVTAGGA